MTDVVAELSLRGRFPPEDRARLAQELVASIEGGLGPEVDAAWNEELRNRIAEVESGIDNLVAANEVFA